MSIFWCPLELQNFQLLHVMLYKFIGTLEFVRMHALAVLLIHEDAYTMLYFANIQKILHFCVVIYFFHCHFEFEATKLFFVENPFFFRILNCRRWQQQFQARKQDITLNKKWHDLSCKQWNNRTVVYFCTIVPVCEKHL